MFSIGLCLISFCLSASAQVKIAASHNDFKIQVLRCAVQGSSCHVDMLFENKGELLGFDKIVILANSDRIHSLSETELFTLLWYCSCRNVFAYQEVYYVSMTRNGVNGKLLHALHKFPLLRIATQAAIKESK